MNKKILLSSILGISLFASANISLAQSPEITPDFRHMPPQAQRMQNPHFNMEERKLFFENELNLTDEQKAKATELRDASKKEIEPLLKQMEQIRTEIDKLRKKDMEKFENEILNEEQRVRLKDLKGQMMKQRVQRFPNKPRKMPMAHTK